MTCADNQRSEPHHDGQAGQIPALKRSASGHLPSCLRRALFDAQNEIDRRREQLIAEIEGKLQQGVSQKRLFSIRWTLE
jgi:hypothetical protein